MEHNRGILHKVAHMYCDEPNDRADLMQDILIQLWTGFPKFRGDSKVSTWMYRIALNTSISRLRTESRKKNVQMINDLPLNVPEDETFREKSEKKQLVQTAISRLEKTEKAIIILYMDDYQYDEIADIIGISPSNVGVKVNRIKKKLKTILIELQNGI